MSLTLTRAAITALSTHNACLKAWVTRSFAQKWRTGELDGIGEPAFITRPARPSKPALLSPADMPRRTAGHSVQNRIALLHALAHIELNAVDLAWDMIARFTLFEGTEMPHDYFDDWVQIADEEAKHFLMLDTRLRELGGFYGELPAHDGLWESAHNTRDNFAARLAVVPMVFEARGLDVTPNMISRLQGNGDHESARILQIIHDEEITHVKNGKKWFEWVADKQDKTDAEKYWQDLVEDYFKGTLKRPFNVDSRNRANFPQDWYEPLAV